MLGLYPYKRREYPRYSGTFKSLATRRDPKGSFLHYTEQERLLLDYLTTHPAITLNQYCRLARIPRIKAENTLAKFIRFELIEPIFENHRFYFRGCT